MSLGEAQGGHLGPWWPWGEAWNQGWRALRGWRGPGGSDGRLGVCSGEPEVAEEEASPEPGGREGRWCAAQGA